MLLPSDIARLVLGYLQQEGLSATSQAFILESPNLKEYAEHSTEDGAIPACVFSLFGKNLTTILNEYVAAKAKETSQEPQIPAMMTSLWKKLEFTLNQIKCMQNSPAVHQNQRLRTRNGIMNLRRQRALSTPLSPAPRISSSPAPPGHYIPSPISAPQSILEHTAAVCYSSLQTRSTPICQPQVPDGSRLFISVNRDSPLQVAVPDHRINPGPLSPARRKCDSPRRRGGGLSGCSGAGRGSLPPNAPPVELQSESHQEAVGESFPQMVIENAREKILNDKSLQEKLAENINKILGSEISPLAAKQAACTSLEQDQSIDEILGLQVRNGSKLQTTRAELVWEKSQHHLPTGEIHMTDDAIQDILEQTESDPAFQALFDLFDCGKDKNNDVDHHGDVETSTPSLERDEAEPGDCFSVTGDQGAGAEDSAPGAETPRKTRARKARELKSKKSRKVTHPLSSSSRTTLALNTPRLSSEVAPGAGVLSQVKMSTEGKTLVCSDREVRTLQPLPEASPVKDANPAVAEKVPEMPPEEDASMDVEEPSDATSQENAGRFILQPEIQQIPQASKDPGGRPCRPSPCESERNPSEAREVEPAERTSEVTLGLEEAEGSVLGFSIEIPHVPEHSAEPQNPEGLPTLSINTDSTVVNNQKAGLEHSPSSQKSPPSLGRCAQGSEATTQEIVHIPEDSSASTPQATLPLSSALALSPAKEANTSKIVSLKIIISDEQEEHLEDSALCQAVSSIALDQVPVILSLPAKSPAKAPGSSGFSVTTEETVQAVSCLQCTELTGRPAEPVAGVDENLQLSLPGELVSEGGFIQLLPPAASYGGSSNYFIVTDQSMVSHSPSVVVLPDGSPLGPVASPTHVLATPPRARPGSVTQDASKTYPSGSTLIITSPVQPMLQSMMVPASVVGQKNPGTFTIVSNQLVTLPVTSAKITPGSKSKPRLAPKEATGSGKAGPPVSGMEMKAEIPLRAAVTLLPSQGPGQLMLSDATITEAAPGPSAPSHRRMLCFDADSPGPGDAAAPSGNAPSPPVTPQTVVSQPPAVSPTASPAVTVSPAVTASPAGQPPKESPGSRAPKIRSVQPTILRGSRAARAELVKCPKGLTTLENERAPPDCAAGDTKKYPHGKSDPGLVAKAPGAIARSEATPPEASGRSVFARKQQIVDKREFSVAESAVPARSRPGGARKEDQRGRPEAGEKPQAKSRDGREARAERRGSSLEPPHVTANKENELEGSQREHHLVGAAPVGEPGLPTVGSPAPVTQAASCKVPSKTSPLTKQAGEMLQDIQGLIPASTPSKRGLGCPELSHPRTPNPGGPAEEPPDCLRTPIRQRHGREREGTPRHLLATPDVPTCSPASEAGSESSINMAAQTLISLSRAGRAGTPLKDSILQQGAASAAVNVATVAPKAKKRKQTESHTAPIAKKELHLSGSTPSKKKSKKQKKLLDSFPDDLDVDKFLSSLHYDE